jgi:hypothetical protein
MFVVSVVCCQDRGLRNELATRPEESYRLWRVAEQDLAGGDLITLVYKVRHPASTLAYRIFGIQIADSIHTKKKKWESNPRSRQSSVFRPTT